MLFKVYSNRFHCTQDYRINDLLIMEITTSRVTVSGQFGARQFGAGQCCAGQFDATIRCGQFGETLINYCSISFHFSKILFIKSISYFAPNCSRRIVATNCPRRIVQWRIVRAELFNGELSASNCSMANCQRRITIVQWRIALH